MESIEGIEGSDGPGHGRMRMQRGSGTDAVTFPCSRLQSSELESVSVELSRVLSSQIGD
jgi:hypothetical protein